MEERRKTATQRIYRDLVPSFPTRSYLARRKNIFESREVGIGQAQEEDDDEERDRLKKLQVRFISSPILAFSYDFFSSLFSFSSFLRYIVGENT
jgi:hypothetical protein